MSAQGEPGRLVLAGAGVAAATYALWAVRKAWQRPPGAVGAHAWVVPIQQARTEAGWTRHAFVHASEHKHG
jgi:hypothetical protein